jgi:hypothetical protein
MNCHLALASAAPIGVAEAEGLRHLAHLAATIRGPPRVADLRGSTAKSSIDARDGSDAVPCRLIRAAIISAGMISLRFEQYDPEGVAFEYEVV